MGTCKIFNKAPVFENGDVVTADQSFQLGAKNVKLPSFVKDNVDVSDKITSEEIIHPWPQDKDKICVMLRNVFSKK